MSFPNPDELARQIIVERSATYRHTAEEQTPNHSKLIRRSVQSIDKGFRKGNLGLYSQPEDAHQAAMKSISGILIWWIGREIVSRIVWYVVNRIFSTYVSAAAAIGNSAGSK